MKTIATHFCIILLSLSVSGCFLFQRIPEGNTLGLSLACDFDTDAGGLGASYIFTDLLGGVAVGPTLEFLRGSQKFNYDIGEFKTQGGISDEIKYNVLRVGARATYPVRVTEDKPVVVYPMLRPGVYYWSNRDFDETETLFTVDIGGGVGYGPLELDIFTTTDGPDLSTRLTWRIPIN